nr:hypothetical protein [Streptomyces sp. DSM 41633]
PVGRLRPRPLLPPRRRPQTGERTDVLLAPDTRPELRRGHLLHTLAGADWELSRAAEALGATREELVRRIRAAGFSVLLKGNV